MNHPTKSVHTTLIQYSDLRLLHGLCYDHLKPKALIEKEIR